MFKKGEPRHKDAGRKVGSKNIKPAALKDMTFQALYKAGGAEYLYEQSQNNPTAFLGLLGKFVPKVVKADIGISGTLNLSALTDDDLKLQIEQMNGKLGELNRARIERIDCGTAERVN